jgi:hypothetical protein
MLSLGSSRPWPEVIRIMTRGRTDRLDARPLLEYFKPLSMWLNIQNREESLVGWSTTGDDTGEVIRSHYDNYLHSKLVVTNSFFNSTGDMFQHQFVIIWPNLSWNQSSVPTFNIAKIISDVPNGTVYFKLIQLYELFVAYIMYVLCFVTSVLILYTYFHLLHIIY